MYVIPPFEAGVTLYRLDGTFKFYATRRLLLNTLGILTIRRAVGPRLDPSLGWRFVILDEDRNPLFAKDFEHLVFKEPVIYTYRRGLGTWTGLGPVPHTGRRRGYRVLRRGFRTAQERRLNAFYDAEAGEPRPRARRIGKNLPSNRDDIVRSSFADRNWKRYRKHQWKD
jgi:hypothetical protein